MAQRPILDYSNYEVPEILFERLAGEREVQSDLNFGFEANDQ